MSILFINATERNVHARRRVRHRCASCGCPEPEATVQTISDLFAAPKVLFIDDDPLVRALLQTAVPALDFQVLTAPNGPTGIEVTRREMPDAVVFDILMPRMSGFEVCRQLRADPALQHIPIILMSARDDPSMAQKGRSVGATCTVGKPEGVEQIMDLLRRALTLPAGRDVLVSNGGAAVQPSPTLPS